jgi:hypothetical protein
MVRSGRFVVSLRSGPPRGGRRRETGDIVQAVDARPPTLRELGIRSHESHRWQRIAILPADAFESIIRDARDHRKELTTSGVLARARRLAVRLQPATAENSSTSERQARAQTELVRRHVRVLLSVDLEQLSRTLEQFGMSAELDHLRTDVSDLCEWLDGVRERLARGLAAPIRRPEPGLPRPAQWSG